ncbi:HpcH/HpaI aldolase family protein [Falsiroseomonas tokyonensis]|uniref:HpcH/HpaI aldolase/citrate lyase family protein n=1 Tax=Falsiroseomonas tokyonensis TaxID=430521 RepID=A0ABV7BWL6_9PROT|nr:aldolase/citrate lyase family protein [Falsiroseomonas tokyonensis]MBU8539927.1 aldolase [Falsiroseomonas tokyonensis]
MPLVPNHVRRRLAEGSLALGFGVHHLRGSATGLIAQATGFDWLFIDMEHGAMSVDDASRIAVAALGQGITPIVRICKDALHEGTRCLDNGAMGVVVPHVDTAAEAEAVVRAYRFPPLGARSWGGPPFAYGLGAVDAGAAQAELNAEILVAVMIETPEAVANAEAIAAVPGVDVLMFGTSDLTATMGIPGQIGHPDVRAAYAKVGAACAARGKVMGMGGVYDEKVAPDYIALGARFILGGNDHSFLMAGAAQRAGFLRGLG